MQVRVIEWIAIEGKLGRAFRRVACPGERRAGVGLGGPLGRPLGVFPCLGLQEQNVPLPATPLPMPPNSVRLANNSHDSFLSSTTQLERAFGDG